MPAVPFNLAGLLGEEQRYVAEVLTAPGAIDSGKYTALCERLLEKRLGAPRVLLTPSGTAALEMCALLMDIKPGDEIIMPSFTFVSTANAFVLRGAVPVFVDILPDDLTIDTTLVPVAITPRTKAIVAVHYAGGACEMAPLRALAQRHDIDIVEDAAHALLSEYQGSALGTIGRFGALSFHATKNITCGEGGALIINDPRDIERAEVVRDKGTDRAQFLRGGVQKYSWVDMGSSYSLSELSAAFLFAQLEQAHTVTERRRAICAAYRKALAPLTAGGRLRFPLQIIGQRDNGHIFYLITESPEIRDALLAHLKGQGIDAAFHYVPLHSSPAGSRWGRISGSMTVTDHVSECLLRLPVFASMTDMQVNQVCAAVRGFYLQATLSAVS